MRKLRCLEVQGLSVTEILDEFNERDFGIKAESDIVSLSVMPPMYPGVKTFDGKEAREPRVTVVITYWSAE